MFNYNEIIIYSIKYSLYYIITLSFKYKIDYYTNINK